MIELTQLNGHPFTLNSDLIETIENIPETKVLLTSGKYFLVKETREEVIEKVIVYRRRIFKNLVLLKEGAKTASQSAGGLPAKTAAKRPAPKKHSTSAEKSGGA